MKKTSLFLTGMLVFALFAMVVSNILLKKEYDKIDKSNTYWTYGRILQEPFRHISIKGGNLTKIVYEPAKKSSVNVFKMWKGFADDSVKAYVRQDTLFVKFPLFENDPYERRFMEANTLVRIFSPELLSVAGDNTNVTLDRFRQQNMNISLSGKSKMEVVSDIYSIDSLNIIQDDSSTLIFKMSAQVDADTRRSPELATVTNELTGEVQNASRAIKSDAVNAVVKNAGKISIRKVDARLDRLSVLHLGNARVEQLNLLISDTAAAILTGSSLKKWKSDD